MLENYVGIVKGNRGPHGVGQWNSADSGAVFREMAVVVFQCVWTGGVDSLDCGTEDMPPDPPHRLVEVV